MRRVTSQRIQTQVHLTNLEFEDFSDAILSRMSCLIAEERYRTYKTTAELVNVNTMASVQSRARAVGFEHEMRSCQFLVYHLAKAIGTEALRPVTLTATDTLMQTFTNHLQMRHSIVVEPRTMTRVSRLVRLFVLDRAARLLYSSPASPYYRQPFSVQHFSYVDAYLYDCEEMFVVAVDMLRHEFVSPSRRATLRSASSYFFHDQLARAADDPAKKAHFMHEHLMVRPYQPTAKMRSSHDALYAGGGGGGDAQAPSAGLESMAGSTYPTSYMNAYARYPNKRIELAATLASRTAASDHVLNKDVAAEQLRLLTREMIRGRRYEWCVADARPRPCAEQPAELPFVPGAIQTSDSIFVHLDLLEQNVDPVDDALERCFGRVAPAERCYASVDGSYKLLGGTPLDGNRPYLLRTRRLEPASRGHALTYKQHTETITRSTLLAFPDMAEAPERYRISDARTRLTQHVDEMSRRARARALFLDEDDVRVGSIDEHERAMRVADADSTTRKRKHVLDIYVNYPEDLVTDEGERTRTARISELMRRAEPRPQQKARKLQPPPPIE